VSKLPSQQDMLSIVIDLPQHNVLPTGYRLYLDTSSTRAVLNHIREGMDTPGYTGTANQTTTSAAEEAGYMLLHSLERTECHLPASVASVPVQEPSRIRRCVNAFMRFFIE